MRGPGVFKIPGYNMSQTVKTKEQVIERMTNFSFSFNKEVKTCGFYRNSGEITDGLLFSSDGLEVLVFFHGPYWYARKATKSNEIYTPSKYASEIATVERSSILKKIKLEVKFDGYAVFNDIVISMKKRSKAKHSKADGVLSFTILSFTIRDKEVEHFAFQYMQDKMSPGIFMDYLKEKYPTLLRHMD